MEDVPGKMEDVPKHISPPKYYQLKYKTFNILPKILAKNVIKIYTFIKPKSLR